MCNFDWNKQNLKFPEEMQKILDKGSWDHGHNFLQIEKQDGTKIDVDVTWNSKLKDVGFLTFPRDWNGENSFIGLKLKQRWDDINMKEKKIQLIESLSPELRERREKFLELLIDWIEGINELR